MVMVQLALHPTRLIRAHPLASSVPSSLVPTVAGVWLRGQVANVPAAIAARPVGLIFSSAARC